MVKRLLTAGFLLILLLQASRQPEPAAASTPAIKVGDWVQVVTDGSRLNLRVSPGVSQAILAKLENGEVLQVIGGPERQDGYTWWQLKKDAITGWAVEDFLRVTSGKAPQPAPTPAGTTSIPALPELFASAESPRIAHAYGFSGICFLGVKLPSINDPGIIEADYLNTFSTAKEVSDRLSSLGYESSAHDDASPAIALANLPKDEIFYFYGHGADTYLVFRSPDCVYSALKSTDIIRSYPNLNLAILLGCETAKNPDSPENILRRFEMSGAGKAIGFREPVWALGANHWNDRFWQYAIDDHMEVSDAARKAALDNIWGYYWIPPPDLVILGSETVYVGDVRSAPPIPTPDDWQQYLQQLLDYLWNQIKTKLLAGLQELIISLLSEAIKVAWSAAVEAVRETCCVPLGLGGIFGLVYWTRRRGGKL